MGLKPLTRRSQTSLPALTRQRAGVPSAALPGARYVPVLLGADAGAAGDSTEASAGKVRVVDYESAGLLIVTQGTAVTCRCNMVCGCTMRSICQGVSWCARWWKPLRYGGGSGHPAAPGQQQSSGQGQRGAECRAAPQGTQLNQRMDKRQRGCCGSCSALETRLKREELLRFPDTAAVRRRGTVRQDCVHSGFG